MEAREHAQGAALPRAMSCMALHALYWYCAAAAPAFYEWQRSFVPGPVLGDQAVLCSESCSAACTRKFPIPCTPLEAVVRLKIKSTSACTAHACGD